MLEGLTNRYRYKKLTPKDIEKKTTEIKEV